MNKNRLFSSKRSPKKRKLLFRLYISSKEVSSLKALSNLKTICSEYFAGNYQIEVIDTLKNPLRVQRDAIVEIPTLIKLSPEPKWTIVGDLSEDAQVLAAMKGPSPKKIKSLQLVR